MILLLFKEFGRLSQRPALSRLYVSGSRINCRFPGFGEVDILEPTPEFEYIFLCNPRWVDYIAGFFMPVGRLFLIEDLPPTFKLRVSV